MVMFGCEWQSESVTVGDIQNSYATAQCRIAWESDFHLENVWVRRLRLIVGQM